MFFDCSRGWFAAVSCRRGAPKRLAAVHWHCYRHGPTHRRIGLERSRAIFFDQMAEHLPLLTIHPTDEDGEQWLER